VLRRSKPDAGPDVTEPAACKRAALDLLARREHSRRELERKLAARGFGHDLVAPALDELESSGALAERRFTEVFIRSRADKGRGPVRIRAELAERGIAAADSADLLRSADVDWAAEARAVRVKRFGAGLPRGFAERARQARFLEYRGFERSQIEAALDSADDLG
jgi:regulatory protein